MLYYLKYKKSSSNLFAIFYLIRLIKNRVSIVVVQKYESVLYIFARRHFSSIYGIAFLTKDFSYFGRARTSHF